MRRSIAVVSATLFLVALYASNFQFRDGGHGGGAAHLRKLEGRQLSGPCDLAGDYKVNGGSEVGVQITQTGSNFVTQYLGVDYSFSGALTNGCAGHLDFGESEGEQPFTFDASTGTMRFTNFRNIYYVKAESNRYFGSSTSSVGPGYTLYDGDEDHYFCGREWTDDWGVGSDMGEYENAATCAAAVQSLNDYMYSTTSIYVYGGFTYISEGGLAKTCIPCTGFAFSETTGTLTSISAPGWDFYEFDTSAPTPAPTSPPTSLVLTPAPTSLPVLTPAPTSFVFTPAPTSFVFTPAPTSFVFTPAPTSFVFTPAPTSFVFTPAPTSFVFTPAPTFSSFTPSPTYSSFTPAPTSSSFTPAPTYFSPLTPAPTYVFTPAPTYGTPAPTYTTDSPNVYYAEFTRGCQLNLNVDECLGYASENEMLSITVNTAGLPRGCTRQTYDDALIYNAWENWIPVDYSGFCASYEIDGTCVLQGVCREEDWTTQQEPCSEGHDMSYTECRELAAVNNVYGAGFGTLYEGTAPKGCSGSSEMGMYYNYYENPWYYAEDYKEGEVSFCRLQITAVPSPQATFAPTPPTPMPTSGLTFAPTPPTPAPPTIDYLFIKNAHGICLDAKNRRDRGGKVHMWPCQQNKCEDADPEYCSGASQFWLSEVDREGACYSTLGGLGKPEMMAEYALKCQRTCGFCNDRENLRNRNQHWDFVRDAGATFGTIKAHDGICLDASEDRNGGKVWMWPCKAQNKRQQWMFDEVSQQIKSKSGYCLDARQRMTVGGHVHLWTCENGNKNQQWQRLVGDPIHDYYGQKLDYSKNYFTTGSWEGPYLSELGEVGEICQPLNGYYFDGAVDGIRFSVYRTVVDVKYPNGVDFFGFTDVSCEGYVDFGIYAGTGTSNLVHFSHSGDKIMFQNGIVFTRSETSDNMFDHKNKKR